VRQLVDGSAAVTLAKSYEPYGSVLRSVGDGSSAYAFAGEQVDASGLLYNRARYYSGTIGRFFQRDSWGGEANSPITQHGYLYAYANPVLYTDPSGHDPWWCDTKPGPGRTLCYQSALGIDPRDLTDWLYREMVENAKGPRTQSLKQINTAGHVGLGGGTGVTIGGAACANPIVAGVGLVIAGGGAAAYAAAGYGFSELVKDHGPWDPKHRIKEYLGEGITLGSKNDVEYSVPGNIHFGFVGQAAGYFDLLIYLGGGIAEISDPAHDPQKAAEAGVSYTPYTGEIGYWGDTRGDHAAIEFGIRLYQTYGLQLTYAQFKAELSKYIAGFDTHAPASWSVRSSVAEDWPYPVGYFDPTK